MPTLQERLAAARVKSEKAIERERQILAKLNRIVRAEESRMRQIIGAGAITADLVDQCLAHVSEKEREFVGRVQKEVAERGAESTTFTKEPSAREAGEENGSGRKGMTGATTPAKKPAPKKAGGKKSDAHAKLPIYEVADDTADLLAEFQAAAKAPEVKVEG